MTPTVLKRLTKSLGSQYGCKVVVMTHQIFQHVTLVTTEPALSPDVDAFVTELGMRIRRIDDTKLEVFE